MYPAFSLALILAGGGIFKGSLGSMLPYIIKAKEDKLGVVMYDDLFKDSVHSGEIDVSTYSLLSESTMIADCLSLVVTR